MTRRKDGLWQQQMTVMVDGRKKQKCFYGKTKAEVLRKIAAYEEEKERGVLFGKVADEWWEKHEPTLAYNSTRNYKPAYLRTLEEFGKTPIKQIVPLQIANHINKFSRTHAQKTVKTQLMVYNLIFKYAVEEGYVLFNPARDLSVPSGLKKKKVTSPIAGDISLIKRSTDCTFGMFAYWAMYTGMRKGELLALTWDDVDLNKRTISITKSVYHVSNTPKTKKPKTETSVGTVPILNALIDKITPGTGLVFPNKDGDLMKESQFRDAWEAYCKESGVSCTPHQLRHAYATMLFEAGIPPEEAQVLLRHAQLSTTMDVYTDLREAKKKAIFEKMYDVDIM